VNYASLSVTNAIIFRGDFDQNGVNPGVANCIENVCLVEAELLQFTAVKVKNIDVTYCI